MSRNTRTLGLSRLTKNGNSRISVSQLELGLDELAALAVIVVALTAIFLRTFG